MFTDRVYLNDILYRIVLYDIVSYYFAICLYYIIQWDIIFYANNVVVLILNLLMSTLLFHFSPLLFDLFFFFFYSIDLINLNIFLTYRNTFIFFSSFSQSYISRATTCFKLINNTCSLSFIWIFFIISYYFFQLLKEKILFGESLNRLVIVDNDDREYPMEIVEACKYTKYLDDGF